MGRRHGGKGSRIKKELWKGEEGKGRKWENYKRGESQWAREVETEGGEERSPQIGKDVGEKWAGGVPTWGQMC